MSKVCTRVSFTPSAAKPLRSVGPQCQARAVGGRRGQDVTEQPPAARDDPENVAWRRVRADDEVER